MNVWGWLVVGIIVAVFLVAGCVKMSTGQRDEGVDYRRDADGRVVLRDTQRMRADAAMAYDNDVKFELSGHKMSNGVSWNDTWLQTIGHLRTGGRENSDWYVQYIVNARREAGLPDLVGLDVSPEKRPETP